MGLKAVGVNNKILHWRAKSLQIDVEVNDASGFVSTLSPYDCFLYARKYPFVSETNDLEVQMSGYNASTGIITFDLYPVSTDLEAGDYVYEVQIRDHINRITLIQDKFTLVESLDGGPGSYPTLPLTLSPTSYLFTVNDISTSFNIVTSPAWNLSAPSWLDVSGGTVGVGSKTIALEKNNSSIVNIPFAQVVVNNSYEVKNFDVSFYYTTATLSPSQYTFSYNDSSTELSLVTSSINEWGITVPSWMSVEPSSGIGDASIVLTTDTSIIQTWEDVNITSLYDYDSSIAVMFNVDVSAGPDYVFSVTDLSMVLYIETPPDNTWSLTPAASWLTFSQTSGVGDTSIDVSTAFQNDDLTEIQHITSTAGASTNVVFSYMYNDIPDYGNLEGFWTFDNTLLDINGRELTTDLSTLIYEDTSINGTDASVLYVLMNGPSWNEESLYHEFNPGTFTYGSDWSYAIWMKDYYEGRSPAGTTGWFQLHRTVGLSKTPGFYAGDWETIPNPGGINYNIDKMYFYGGNGDFVPDVSKGKWNHVAWTYNSTTHKATFYANGVYMNEFIVSSLWLGGPHFKMFASSVPGYVRDLAVYNKTIDASSVEDLYNRF